MEKSSVLLRTVELRDMAGRTGYPFDLPVVRSFEPLQFTAPVTFFVGENGCGKSTLLEAIACAAGSITVGSETVERDRTLDPVRPLGNELKLVWTKRTRRGFFMRSEDFFGFARKLASIKAGMQADLQRVKKDYAQRSRLAQELGALPYKKELYELRQSYGEDPDASSHGESYLRLFQARFAPGGLYLLDEPEAPLSPLRQLSFLFMLKTMVAQDAQFIIATHSPLLMAFPGATILNFDGGRIEQTAYAELEHVRIMKAFLEDPQRYLNALFEEG